MKTSWVRSSASLRLLTRFRKYATSGPRKERSSSSAAVGSAVIWPRSFDLFRVRSPIRRENTRAQPLSIPLSKATPRRRVAIRIQVAARQDSWQKLQSERECEVTEPRRLLQHLLEYIEEQAK